MANSTEIDHDNSIVRADFIQELLPSAERTALLYHLTFLSLGGFPKLECMIRKQAVETQLLFGSSEAVLLKCVATSSQLVSTLFPILKVAVEKNKPGLVKGYLKKAEKWISDITARVDDIVKRYDDHNIAVSTCTSGVFKEQEETKEQKQKKSDEMKGLEDALAKFEQEMNRVVDEIQINENKMKTTNDELNNFLRRFKEEHGHWTKKFVNFFRGYPDAMKDPDAIAITTKLKQLESEKDRLHNEEWNIKIQQTDHQLKLANCKIRMGEIPDPDHLQEVTQCLSQIQQILVELKKFWENIDVVLKTLEEQTFTGDEIAEQGEMGMDALKELFLISIEDAANYWKKFGMCCKTAQGVFRVQSREAYRFLEINPSSLSEKERNEQYLCIMEKLKKIHPDPPALSVTQTDAP